MAYGVDEIEQAIEYDAVGSLALSEKLPTDQIREYEQQVEERGGKAVIVSADFERGDQLRSVFDGMAAILRFPIN